MSTSSGLPRHDGSAPRQQDQSIGELPGQGEVVHGAEHGQAALAAQGVDQLQRLDAPPEVERTGGLVEEEDGRLLGQGPGEHQALQLATRQRPQPTLGHGRQVERPEEVGAHAAVLGPSRTPK